MEKKSVAKYFWLGLIILIVIIIVVIMSLKNSNNAPTANTPVASNTNSTSSGLMGTWVSATPSKGMEGSGKITFRGTAYQVTFVGDINLKIEKVENNTGTGVITFSNLCLTTTTQPAQCVKTYTEPAVMQISGNTIKYTGQTVLGANISLTGTFTNNSMSGTFIRTSTAGTTNGTFNLVRAKS